jgi:hypothetical protein
MDMLIVLHLNPITLYLGSQAIPFWTHWNGSLLGITTSHTVWP